MLQPVLPYAIVGLALGSLFKRPGTGALVGSVVGLARTTAEPSGISGFGSYGFTSLMGVDMKGAPTVAPTIATAKLAAGYAYKISDPEGENQGWSPKQIATEWSAAPWNRYSTPTAILRAAQLAVKGKKGEKQANYYLKKVKKETQKLPLSKREFEWKYKHEPLPSSPLAKGFAKYFKAKTGKELPKKKRTPVQGPRGDTKQYISASPSPFEGSKWYQTTGGKVGIAALAGVSALVLVLMLTGKKR
jgi:hypothetical protein